MNYAPALVHCINEGNTRSKHWESRAIRVVNSVFAERLRKHVSVKEALAYVGALPTFYLFPKPAIQEITFPQTNQSAAAFTGLAPNTTTGYQSWYFVVAQCDGGGAVVVMLYQTRIDVATGLSAWALVVQYSKDGSTWAPAFVHCIDNAHVRIRHNTTEITDPLLAGSMFEPAANGVRVRIQVTGGMQLLLRVNSALGPRFHAPTSNVSTWYYTMVQNSWWTYPDGVVAECSVVEQQGAQAVLAASAGSAWFEYQRFGFQNVSDFDIMIFACIKRPLPATWIQVAIHRPDLWMDVRVQNAYDDLVAGRTVRGQGTLWRKGRTMYNVKVALRITAQTNHGDIRIPTALRVTCGDAVDVDLVSAAPVSPELHFMASRAYTIVMRPSAYVLWVPTAYPVSAVVRRAKLSEALADAFTYDAYAVTAVVSIWLIVIFVLIALVTASVVYLKK